MSSEVTTSTVNNAAEHRSQPRQRAGPDLRAPPARCGDQPGPGRGSSGPARRPGREPGVTGADPRRWLILAVVALAQLMVVLDATIVNIALPSAQHALHFSNIERQWVVTAYALAFGSLLLLGGRLTDLIGRKATFIAGLIGFAGASAVGGRGEQLRHARRGPRLPGRLRRAAGPGRAVPADHHVRGHEGPGQGVRRLRRHRRRRRRGRPAARRAADPVPDLALVPVRQPRLRRDRVRRSRRAAAPAAGQPAGHGWTCPGSSPRSAACSASSTASPTRPATAGTRHRPGASSPRAWCCSRRSATSRHGPRSRCCRCGSSWTATGPLPTCRSSSPAPACSASSCSSPTTCRRPWASARS